MVCKHKSEWSYKWAKIKSDYEKFIKYHYPKAKQEYVNERLDEIQAKYDALYDFWYKLEFKTDTFWYFEPFAWVEQMNRVFERAEIIFPLLVKPENDKDGKWGKNYYWAANQKSNQTTFNSNRGGGKRKHAGRDLYTQPLTPVVVMADGIVIGTGNFYAGTDYIAIYHKTPSGREFIINYGEVDPNKKMVKKGDTVKKGQQLGVTGYLKNINVIEGELIYMLHFEYYSGREGFNLDKNHILGHSNMYKRRSDLEDPLKILEEAYKNTFKYIN
ncbi:M23 family metallopeptidase [Capnocytophaga cynodegmi]|uniref:M23 family metallopeptidase n=1 Tax=Capnocytophaga cynodegmi TaxID=28189 RepID=UPI00385C676E